MPKVMHACSVCVSQATLLDGIGILKPVKLGALDELYAM